MKFCTRLSIIVLLCLVQAYSASGQIGKLRALVSNYIETGSYEKEIEASIPMAIIEPGKGVLNTSDFADSFPNLRIERESIKLEYPDLSQYIDTIHVVWFLKDMTYSTRGESNIVIFAVTDDLEIHYYFDNNNDRKFSPGETVVVFEPWEENRAIEISINERNEYLFANPFYEPQSADESNKLYYETWEITSRSISTYIFGGFSFGRGDAYVSYDSKRPSVNRIKYFGGIFASGRFTIGLGLEWKHLNLQGWGAFEVLDYDETWRYEYTDISCNLSYNTGVWMKQKLYAGLELAYDIMITEGLSIGPAVSYSAYTVLGNKPIDPALDYDPDAKYHDTNVIEYIIRMRVISSERSKMEFRVYYSDTSLDACEFFPDFDGAYSSSYNQVYFGASYISRFGK